MERCESPSSGLEVRIDGSPSRLHSKQPFSSPFPSPLPSTKRSWERATTSEKKSVFETAKRCVEDGLSLRGKEMQHARHFAGKDFAALKEAFPIFKEGKVSPSLTSISFCPESDEKASVASWTLPQTPDGEVKQKNSIWKKIRNRLSSENVTSDANSPTKVISSSPTKIAALHCSPDEHIAGLSAGSTLEKEESPVVNNFSASRAFALLCVAAPLKGNVIHWVWLMRAFMNKCHISDATQMLKYLANIGKSISPEEQWLRLLAIELRPQLNLMRANQLSPENQALTRMVADRAMQVCHEAIRDFRTCHSSKLENAAVLSSAMQLQMLVTKCASNEDCQDMAAIFEEQLAAAAQRRFQSLCSLSSEDAGLSSPTAGPRDLAERRILSNTAVCEQLIEDISDDERCYQAHVPTGCSIRLAEISCRTYGTLLRLELMRMLEQPVNADRNFFELFSVVSSLQKQILQHSPATLGPESCFCDDASRPVFMQSLEAWMRIVRTKLMQWSMRLLKEEVWQHSMTPIPGSRCSPSLVELFRGLNSVTEENQFVSGACIMYAGLMERTLGKLVLVHVAGLESLCQGELPSRPGKNFAGQLRSLGSRGTRECPAQDFQPSTGLCMLLNDLREIRSKHADLAGLLRSCVDAGWWGGIIQADSTDQRSIRLGDRFKACQVEIERRYSTVLHHIVKKLIHSWRPMLTEMLDSPAQRRTSHSEDAVTPTLMAAIHGELDRLAGLLDVRVQKRISRELWNELAGALQDNLLACQGNQEGSQYHSLGNIAPHVQRIDLVLKDLSHQILASKASGLVSSDAPEKVIKLQRMLALFLREDEGLSLESI